MEELHSFWVSGVESIHFLLPQSTVVWIVPGGCGESTILEGVHKAAKQAHPPVPLVEGEGSTQDIGFIYLFVQCLYLSNSLFLSL